MFKSRRFRRSVGFGSGTLSVGTESDWKRSVNGYNLNMFLRPLPDWIWSRGYLRFQSRIWKATLKNFGVKSLGFYPRSGIDKIRNSKTDVENADKDQCQSLKPSCIRIVCMELVFRIRLRYILSRYKPRIFQFSNISRSTKLNNQVYFSECVELYWMKPDKIQIFHNCLDKSEVWWDTCTPKSIGRIPRQSGPDPPFFYFHCKILTNKLDIGRF